jgi:DNA-binding winged helix-turn-helix (wHTH) protein
MKTSRQQEDTPILIAQSGPLKGQRFFLDKSIVIGRESSCEVVIPDRQVSRFHARIVPEPEGVVLEDLGSKNGTHCNGNNITTPVALKDGDMVQIALAQQFIFLTSDATVPLTDELDHPGLLKLDNRSRRVWVNNQIIEPPLSALQFHVLRVLYESAGLVIDRQELISKAWGDEQSAGVTDQALDALIRRLRDRLAAIEPTHEFIVTIRGHGIRLDNPPGQSEV